MNIPNSSRPVKHRNVRETPGTAENGPETPGTATSDPMAGALALLHQLQQMVAAGDLVDHYGIARKAAQHLRVTTLNVIENGGAHHGQ